MLQIRGRLLKKSQQPIDSMVLNLMAGQVWGAHLNNVQRLHTWQSRAAVRTQEVRRGTHDFVQKYPIIGVPNWSAELSSRPSSDPFEHMTPLSEQNRVWLALRFGWAMAEVYGRLKQELLWQRTPAATPRLFISDLNPTSGERLWAATCRLLALA